MNLQSFRKGYERFLEWICIVLMAALAAEVVAGVVFRVAEVAARHAPGRVLRVPDPLAAAGIDPGRESGRLDTGESRAQKSRVESSAV